MATITAIKDGDWSDVTVWDLGRIPQDTDIVDLQSYAIEFDVDKTPETGELTAINHTTGRINVNLDLGNSRIINSELIESINAVGGFAMIYVTGNATNNNSLTINSNLTSSTASAAMVVNNASKNTVVINGNITAYTSGSTSTSSVNNTSTGYIIINGNCIGTDTQWPVYISTGEVIIEGNLSGTRGAVSSNGKLIINGSVNCKTGIGIYLSGNSADVILNGNLTSGSNYGAQIAASGALVINGNVLATTGYGIYKSGGSGTITVNGNITGGLAKNSKGLYIASASSATIVINGTVSGGTYLGSDGSSEGIVNDASGTSVTLNGNAHYTICAPFVGDIIFVAQRYNYFKIGEIRFFLSEQEIIGGSNATNSGWSW